MKTQTFLDNFGHLADTPNGIQKLRELILQLAVQGKLVPQDLSDEPASVLLEKIKAEKPLPVITADEVPYALPKGWEWVRFGKIFSLEYGDNLPADKRSNTGEFPVYGSNGIVGTHNVSFVNAPCIVVGRKGSAGALNLSRSQGCCVTDVAYYCIPPAGIDLSFSFKLFHTLGLESLGKGIKPGLNRNEAYALIVAVPPLPEQRRIVTKVDQLMALCDELEERKQRKAKLSVQLNNASLDRLLNAESPDDFNTHWQRICDNFQLLYDNIENVNKLRSAILQLAVQGKLVPQDPNDEPASALLEKIKTEKARLVMEGKIRKQEPLAPIKNDEKPYDLPKGWEVVRLNDIFDVRDGTHDSPKYVSTGFPLVTSKNLSTGALDLTNIKFITEKDHIKICERSKVDKLDILFAMIGSIGNPVIVDIEPNFSIKNVALFKYYSRKLSVPRYLYYFLIHASENMRQKAAGGVQSFVSLSFLRNYVFPLPPLEEQSRIVAKVDQLMALCDELEARLKQSQADGERLMEAVVNSLVTA